MVKRHVERIEHSEWPAGAKKPRNQRCSLVARLEYLGESAASARKIRRQEADSEECRNTGVHAERHRQSKTFQREAREDHTTRPVSTPVQARRKSPKSDPPLHLARQGVSVKPTWRNSFSPSCPTFFPARLHHRHQARPRRRPRSSRPPSAGRAWTPRESPAPWERTTTTRQLASPLQPPLA